MKLILARHGNTFAPGDTVVWAGATNDLPLVQKGLIQAETLALSLIKNKIVPAAIYCGPLQRTFEYASIISKTLGAAATPIIDSRLNEIDYGEWTGISNEEVKAKFGEEALSAWDNHSVWPRVGNWGGSEEATIKEVQSFAAELVRNYDSEDQVLVVSSNGRLRYFLTLVENEFEKRKIDGTFKVKTGNICKLVSTETKKFQLKYWNINPTDTVL